MGFAWLAAAAAGLAVASAAEGAAPLPTCRKPAPPPPSPSGCMPVAFKLCGQFGGNTLSCEACAATHAAELGEAGCTKAQITGFCTSPLGKCEAQLFKDGCITAGPQGCTVCAASHRKDLTKVCASEQEVEQLCKDATHPAARFVREGEPRVTAHALGYDIIEETLVTQSYFLADGELIFTDFDSTPIPMPTGDYAILSLGGEMVDCNNVSVPLDTLYNHHWLLKPISGPTHHENAPCPQQGDNDFSYVFGVGAESRKTPTVIPEGFGYHVKAGTKWGGNIHVLHTQGLEGGQQGIKECIECWAGPQKHCGNNAQRNGSFDCCDQGTCPTASGTDKVPTEYRMKMVLRYTRDTTLVAPVDMETYLSPDCQYEYNADTESSPGVNAVSKTWAVDKDKEYLFMVGHMHSGGLNVSLFVNDEFICASYPIYGTVPGVPGNEKGHLIEVTRCVDDGSAGGYPGHAASSYRNHSLSVKVGDKVRVDGYYWVGAVDPRIAPTPAGPHLGVMSYMYGVFHTGHTLE